MFRLIVILDALFIVGALWVIANLVHFFMKLGSTGTRHQFFALSNLLSGGRKKGGSGE